MFGRNRPVHLWNHVTNHLVALRWQCAHDSSRAISTRFKIRIAGPFPLLSHFHSSLHISISTGHTHKKRKSFLPLKLGMRIQSPSWLSELLMERFSYPCGYPTGVCVAAVRRVLGQLLPWTFRLSETAGYDIKPMSSKPLGLRQSEMCRLCLCFFSPIQPDLPPQCRVVSSRW